MTEHKNRSLWYTRRDSVERGPYPEKQISRYILIGRIHSDDELRSTEGEWQAVHELPELIPDVMKLPPSKENLQKLATARMREDERDPGDRRDRDPDPPRCVIERRSGDERRRCESDAILRHRIFKYQMAHAKPGVVLSYRSPIIMATVVALAFVLNYFMGLTGFDFPEPDCSASPHPGVNWNNCNLSGIDASRAALIGAQISNASLDSAIFNNAQFAGASMQYTSLVLSNLQGADLNHANLVGTVLRGADLRNASLAYANLSYVNLSGANIEGADFTGALLDNAIWIDQKLCASGSVGMCKALH